MSRLVKNTHVDYMEYEPAILFLNGAYWGLYGIREKMDEHYIESHYGVPSDEVDLLNRDNVLAGSDTGFVNMHDFITTVNPIDSGYYGQVDAMLDIENYCDYFAIETFIQNKDWCGIAWGLNNVKIWRPQQAGGKLSLIHI